MTIDILVCTIDAGIRKVPDVLMSPMDDVRYVVSMQYTDRAYVDEVPEVLKQREDVTVTLLEGPGLSRNRNNAIDRASGDVLVIADDDNRYERSHIDTIIRAYSENESADIIHFQAQTYEGGPLHPYPVDFVSSVELTFRRRVAVRFDERFGLGSRYLCAGEEAVFIKDARARGYGILYVPRPIVRTRAVTTGDNFLHNSRMQLTKGATFRYLYGTSDALWRSVKEAGWYLVHRGANPFPIVYYMWKGIALQP